MVTEERTVWKCLVEGCNYTGAPTVEGYYKVGGHRRLIRGCLKRRGGFIS